MSYRNYVPRVWNTGFEHELERNFVFGEDCNKQYEGKVSNLGDTIKILGVGKPTIKTQSGGSILLEDPEVVEDTAISMPINQIAYYNYMVDDIDKRQAQNGIMEALSTESARSVSNELDLYIASLAKDKMAVRNSAQATALTKDNILPTIDTVLAKLYENDVKPSDFISLTCGPTFYMLLKQAYTALDTDNSKMLENGKVGRYGNVIVRMSNNVQKDTNGNDLVMVRTNKAIAFAKPMIHSEPYRPEKRFSDAIKGFVLYDAKIVRPKELIVLNCKIA